MAARTKRFQEISVYTWELENYSTLTGELLSPQFYFLDGSKWELVLRTGVFHNFLEQEVIYIRRVTPNSTVQHRISVDVCIQDKDGVRSHERTQVDIYIADGWNYLVWSIDKPVLVRDSEELLPNDCLIVQCRLGSDFPLQTDDHRAAALQRTGSALERLSTDLNMLFENADHADVILKCGERTISAHRSILAARSEVFSAMFRHDMIEKCEGTVNIEDIEYEDFYKLLRYIYCSRIDGLTTEHALHLYEAADKYAVETLKDECSLFLKRHLSTLNVCDVLVLADAHGDDNLKDFVICFLLTSKKFLTSRTWKGFCKHHTTLSNEVLLCFVEVNNEWEEYGMILS